MRLGAVTVAVAAAPAGRQDEVERAGRTLLQQDERAATAAGRCATVPLPADEDFELIARGQAEIAAHLGAKATLAPGVVIPAHAAEGVQVIGAGYGDGVKLRRGGIGVVKGFGCRHEEFSRIGMK